MINVCDAVRPDGAPPARRGRRTARCRTERAYSGGPLGPMDAASPVVTPRSASPQPLAAGPCTQAWLGWLPGRTGPWSVRPVCDLAGTCGLLPGTTIASNFVSFFICANLPCAPRLVSVSTSRLAPFVASRPSGVLSHPMPTSAQRPDSDKSNRVGRPKGGSKRRQANKLNASKRARGWERRPWTRSS